MMNFTRSAVVFLLIIVLSGCSTNGSHKARHKSEHFSFVVKELSSHNVATYRHAGSTYLLLPDSYFFTTRSANFSENAYGALELVLALSRHFRDSPLVTVIDYHDDKYGTKLGRALAMERARRVVEYLWQAGIDVTFMYADGKHLDLGKRKKTINDYVVIKFVH